MTFEGDYYVFYFENNLCVCDLSTYYTKSTLNNNKVRKLLILFYDHVQSIWKFAKNIHYENVERWLFRVDFENIFCWWDLLTYYTRFTLNNDKVKKKINIVLVTIFYTFQNLTNHLYKDVWRWLLLLLFSEYFMCMWSPQILP